MLKTLYNVLRGAFRWARRSILLIGCIFFLTVNILTLTSSFVQSALAASLGALGIQSVYSSLASTIDRQKGNIRKQKSTISRQTKANRKARRTIRSQKAAVKKVGGRISKRTLRLAAVNLAAIPAESIPLVGVGVILAVTGYELHQTCDNVDDMNSIYASMGIRPDVDPGLAERTCLGYISKYDNFVKLVGDTVDMSKAKQIAEDIISGIDGEAGDAN